MADIQAAAALVTSTKAALDIFKNMIGMRDDIELQRVRSELQMKLLEVLDLAVTAKTEQFVFVERERSLEKEIAELKEWKAREGEYRLEEVSPGAFAYVSQPTGDASAPEVWLCPTCFENKQRRFLLFGGFRKGGIGEEVWNCATCKTSLVVNMGLTPGNWRQQMQDIRRGQSG